LSLLQGSWEFISQHETKLPIECIGVLKDGIISWFKIIGNLSINLQTFHQTPVQFHCLSFSSHGVGLASFYHPFLLPIFHEGAMEGLPSSNIVVG
jgi:hypothetical protein